MRRLTLGRRRRGKVRRTGKAIPRRHNDLEGGTRERGKTRARPREEEGEDPEKREEEKRERRAYIDRNNKNGDEAQARPRGGQLGAAERGKKEGSQRKRRQKKRRECGVLESPESKLDFEA